MWHNNTVKWLALTGAALSLLTLNACTGTGWSAVKETPVEAAPAPVAAKIPAPAPPKPQPAPRNDYREPAAPPRIVMFDPNTGRIVDDTPTRNNADTHTVSKGDTLFALSKRYGCTVQQIMNWNRLKNPNISIGQILRVSPTNS